MLEDIAILTGGRVITEDLGIKLENVKWEDLGDAKKVVITKDDTTIVTDSDDKAGKRDRSPAASSRSAIRSRRPPPTTIARSCRSGWPSWSAVWP